VLASGQCPVCAGAAAPSWRAAGAPDDCGQLPPDLGPARLFRGLARIAGRPGGSAADVRARPARWARD